MVLICEIVGKKKKRQNTETPPEPEKKNLSVVKYDLFLKTVKEKIKGRPKLEQQIKNRLDYIYTVKNQNIMASVGGNDKPLNGTLSGFMHCHLTRDPDLALIYKIKNNTLHLYAIAQHDEYNTMGNSRKSLTARVLNSQPSE